jgi:nucleoside 2-deoxyribosyltransferase
MNKKPLGYLGGDIMTHGSNLARQEEYDKFKEAHIPGEVYSPVQNKSINDKSNMTEEENNHLAEKIVAADVERLWNSDYTVLCPEQSAIGTMCEMGILYGWKYMADKLLKILEQAEKENWTTEDYEFKLEQEIKRIVNKKNYAHYFDIRTNHLNEKDWRRSFSINQFLYGIILAATADGTLHNSFDEILPLLQKEYIKEEQLTFETDWR